MPHPPKVRRRTLLGRGSGRVLACLVLLCLEFACLGLGTAARAQSEQGVELTSLRTTRADGELSLDFNARIVLPRAVEDALSRGVPVYFRAEASLWRNRWYWRDERVARVSRQWRVAFQPLTGQYRLRI